MSLAAESVTLAGSGLVFVNTYDPSVTPAYRDAILAAEHELESHFTNQVTVNVVFRLAPLDVERAAAENSYSQINVSYDELTSALRANATTSADLLAVGGLPLGDPSGGAGFAVPYAEARILGLAGQSESVDDIVVLNSNLDWSYGQDAIGAIEHELSEGVFGRVGSLGSMTARWAPMDLFRFTSSGVRDYTGGSDGLTTYFGLDSSHLSNLAFHNSVDSSGAYDGFDLADWESTLGDAFGPGGPGAAGFLSRTDLQVLDILGWSSAPFTPAADDYANSRSDLAHAMGQLSLGGYSFGVLEQAGDRDWFQVNLQAGQTYAFLMGPANGTMMLGGALLRIHGPDGALLAQDTAVLDQAGVSELVFTATSSGTFYVEAGGVLDGYAGSYALQMGQSGAAATAGDDFLVGKPGGDSLLGGDGSDTLAGGDGANQLFAGPGDDLVFGGKGQNSVNGNKGDDLIIGQSTVGDQLFGGQGNDFIDAARSTAHNYLNGNLGDDLLIGGSGGDTLRGGQGSDDVRGGSGADWLSGDLGVNTLYGGAGADTFHAGAGMDTVVDFHSGEGDRVLIDLGVTYTTTQAGDDVIIGLSNGGQMTVRNVQLSSLPIGWIFLA